MATPLQSPRKSGRTSSLAHGPGPVTRTSGKPVTNDSLNIVWLVSTARMKCIRLTGKDGERFEYARKTPLLMTTKSFVPPVTKLDTSSSAISAVFVKEP